MKPLYDWKTWLMSAVQSAKSRWEIPKLGWCGYRPGVCSGIQSQLWKHSQRCWNQETLQPNWMARRKEYCISSWGNDEEQGLVVAWVVWDRVWPGVQPVCRARVGRAAQQHPRSDSAPLETGNCPVGLLRAQRVRKAWAGNVLGEQKQQKVHDGSCSTASFCDFHWEVLR